MTITPIGADPAVSREIEEEEAREVLRELVGPDYSSGMLSDATAILRVAHRRALRLGATSVGSPPPRAALDRLFELARSDTGQSARVANFLLAWWNGADHGHFAIADLFGLDAAVADDITAVIAFIGRHPGAIYADSLGYRAAVMDLLARWRGIEIDPAEAA